MKMVLVVPRLQKLYNTVHVQHSNIKFNKHMYFIFPSLSPPPRCLQLAWSQNALCTSLLPTLYPNSKHSHTCYGRIAHKWCTAGIVFSSILFTKREAYSICCKRRNFKPIDRDSEPSKEIPLIIFAVWFYYEKW